MIETVDMANRRPGYGDLVPPVIVKDHPPDPHAENFTTRFRQRRGSYGRHRRRGSLKKPKGKQVRFHNDLETALIPCVYGVLTRQEAKAVWYKSRDYESFEKDKRRTINRLKNAGGDVTDLDPEVFSLRGIEEYQSVQTHREKRQKRMDHARSILEEQDRQMLMNVQYDPYAFRNVVRESTESSMNQALLAAQRDERHAAAVHGVSPKSASRNRRSSVRWVRVDTDDQVDEIPRGGGRRDSLNLARLKQSVLDCQNVLSEDDELKSLVSDDASNDDSTSGLHVDLAKFAEEFGHLYDDDEYNEPLPPPPPPPPASK